MKVIKQKKWTVDARDFLRGLTLAIISALVAAISEPFFFEEFSWLRVGRIAFIAGAVYIGKKFTDADKVVVVLDKEQNVDQTARRIENNV